MFIRAILCALAGLFVGIDDAPLLGFIGGGALGLLWAQLVAQREAQDALRRELAEASKAAGAAALLAERAERIAREGAAPRAPSAAEPPAAPQPAAPIATGPTPVVQRAEPEPTLRPPPRSIADELVAARSAEPPARPAPPAPSAQMPRSAPRPAPEPDAFERAFAAAKRWLLSGNVPVKVGVILSFIGVAFLLKYAVDEGLLSFPIELRLAGVALGGIALLVVGWRLRERERVYALTVQGGGIGILYLTVFAAFRLYHLLPAPLAFGLLVLLTVGLALLAVLQRAQTLAVFGVVGGFLAPVLVSTGSGSHVALFSYYLVLNLAIAGIAWSQAWRPLNWLGFVFTFAIGTAWGFPYYKPEHFATVEPFLVAHFLLYTAIAVVFALRHGPQLKGYVDGTLIFGLPLVCFALQWQLVAPWEKGQAWSALALALFYVPLAALLFRRRTPEARLLAESFIALGVGFATIAIPLALDAQWTSASWALEGAGLIWVALRQGRVLSRWSGIALQLLAALTLLRGWTALSPEPLLLNGRFLGGMILALGAGASALLLERGPARHAEPERFAAWGLFGLALIAWYATGLAEIGAQVRPAYELGAALLFAIGSAVGAFLLGARLGSASLRATALVALPALALLALVALAEKTHPAADLGWAAWPLAFLAYAWLARRAVAIDALAARALAIGGLWIGALLLAREAHWQLGEVGDGAIWSWAAVVAVLAGLARLVGADALRARWPSLEGLGDGMLAGAAFALASALLLGSRGDPAPLPFLPLLNPLDLAALAALAVALRWWRRHGALVELDAGAVATLVAGFGFVLVTMEVVRCFHHWDSMPFRLGAAFRHDGLQAALSIVWATLGVAAMAIGARRATRIVWVAGATLMGVVVLKLFLVDLGNTGTVARIVSFIGVGVLLLVIGYLAPLPARQPENQA